MRKIGFSLLAIFKACSRFLSKLRGRTLADIASERVVSGRIWDEFCMSLKSAGTSLNFPGSPKQPFYKAEGNRYLSRLARAGLMATVAHADDRASVIEREFGFYRNVFNIPVES